VRIQNAGLKGAARGSVQMQDPKSRQKSPSGHHPTTLSGYIFATEACIDNRKKSLSSNISSTCPHNMMNFSRLAAEIVSLVWGTPDNFNGFRVLAALLHGTLVVGVSQTAALNRGRHLYSAGRPWRWALAHTLVLSLTLEALQGKRCQESLLSGFRRGRSVRAKISGKRSSLGNIFMAALCNRGAIIFLPCSFFLSISYLSVFLFFPRLISAATDWMSTILLHMAWP